MVAPAFIHSFAACGMRRFKSRLYKNKAYLLYRLFRLLLSFKMIG